MKHVFIAGFAEGHHIGVDVELLNLRVDREQVARSFFSPAEWEDYAALDPSERPRGFVNGWTRKEAFMKAIGLGLHCDLRSFDVNLEPKCKAQILRAPKGYGSPADWTLHTFEPFPHYIGAVALDRRQVSRTEIKINGGPGPVDLFANELNANAAQKTDTAFNPVFGGSYRGLSPIPD